MDESQLLIKNDLDFPVCHERNFHFFKIIYIILQYHNDNNNHDNNLQIKSLPALSTQVDSIPGLLHLQEEPYLLELLLAAVQSPAVARNS